jgi:hypothetical protein
MIRCGRTPIWRSSAFTPSTAHTIVRNTWAAVPVGVAEDGGELVMVSLMLAAVFRHAQPPSTSSVAVEAESISQAA